MFEVVVRCNHGRTHRGPLELLRWPPPRLAATNMSGINPTGLIVCDFFRELVLQALWCARCQSKLVASIQGPDVSAVRFVSFLPESKMRRNLSSLCLFVLLSLRLEVSLFSSPELAVPSKFPLLSRQCRGWVITLFPRTWSAVCLFEHSS